MSLPPPGLAVEYEKHTRVTEAGLGATSATKEFDK
jgi:hypothetical protein